MSRSSACSVLLCFTGTIVPQTKRKSERDNKEGSSFSPKDKHSEKPKKLLVFSVFQSTDPHISRSLWSTLNGMNGMRSGCG